MKKINKKNIITILMICVIVVMILGGISYYSHDSEKEKEIYAAACMLLDEQLKNESLKLKDNLVSADDIRSMDTSGFDYSRLKINRDGSFYFQASDGNWYLINNIKAIVME